MSTNMFRDQMGHPVFLTLLKPALSRLAATRSSARSRKLKKVNQSNDVRYSRVINSRYLFFTTATMTTMSPFSPDRTFLKVDGL